MFIIRIYYRFFSVQNLSACANHTGNAAYYDCWRLRQYGMSTVHVATVSNYTKAMAVEL